MLGMRDSRISVCRKLSNCASMYARARGSLMGGEGSMRDEEEDEGPLDEDAVVEMEIEDELDLHTFAPRDVKGLVEDYLTLAAEKGFAEVRIVHGKGTGTLRR